MTQATALRRTYTTKHPNDDDSVIISSASSSTRSSTSSYTSSPTSSESESEKKTYASEKKSIENFIKNTSNTEAGKLKKKSESN